MRKIWRDWRSGDWYPPDADRPEWATYAIVAAVCVGMVIGYGWVVWKIWRA